MILRGGSVVWIVLYCIMHCSDPGASTSRENDKPKQNCRDQMLTPAQPSPSSAQHSPAQPLWLGNALQSGIVHPAPWLWWIWYSVLPISHIVEHNTYPKRVTFLPRNQLGTDFYSFGSLFPCNIHTIHNIL